MAEPEGDGGAGPRGGGCLTAPWPTRGGKAAVGTRLQAAGGRPIRRPGRPGGGRGQSASETELRGGTWANGECSGKDRGPNWGATKQKAHQFAGVSGPALKPGTQPPFEPGRNKNKKKGGNPGDV